MQPSLQLSLQLSFGSAIELRSWTLNPYIVTRYRYRTDEVRSDAACMNSLSPSSPGSNLCILFVCGIRLTHKEGSAQ